MPPNACCFPEALPRSDCVATNRAIAHQIFTPSLPLHASWCQAPWIWQPTPSGLFRYPGTKWGLLTAVDSPPPSALSPRAMLLQTMPILEDQKLALVLRSRREFVLLFKGTLCSPLCLRCAPLSIFYIFSGTRLDGCHSSSAFLASLSSSKA